MPQDHGPVPDGETVPPPPTGRLRPLGVSDVEEVVYHALLVREASSVQDLAAVTARSPSVVSRALTSLRAHGLVNRLAGTPPRFAVIEPDAAITSLINSRSLELQGARQAAVDLSRHYYSVPRARARGTDSVEVLSGHELGQWFSRMHHEADEEMLVLDRPPYALADTNPLEPASLVRGVRWRAIYSAGALEAPGALTELGRLQALGEESRTLPELPMKLAIADRRLALFPLHLTPDPRFAVLVHPSALLDGLLELFESLWRSALPITPSGEPGEDGLAEDRQLAELLASGISDQAVARQLGWSMRTLRRRLNRMYEALPAGTRFQAGARAVQRGWLDRSPRSGTQGAEPN